MKAATNQYVSGAIDGPTAAPEAHSQLVAASAAVSKSAPSAESNHEVYVWLAKLKMEQYFESFLADG